MKCRFSAGFGIGKVNSGILDNISLVRINKKILIN